MLMRTLALKISDEINETQNIVTKFDEIKDTEQRTLKLVVAELCLLAAMEGLRAMKKFHEQPVYEDAIAEPSTPPHEPPQPVQEELS